MRRSTALVTLAVVGALTTTAALQVREIQRLHERHATPVVLATGHLAEELAGVDEAGRAVRLSELRGKAVIVTFWASWCLPCRVELPELARFANEWNRAGQRKFEVVVLAANAGERPTDARDVVRSEELKAVRFVFDDTRSNLDRWKVEAFPTTYLIGPDGTIVLGNVGYERFLAYRLHRSLEEVQNAARTD